MQTKNHVTSKSGVISKDEKWFGDILIEDNVVIAHGVSVTVLPGAKIKFAVKKSYPENKEYFEKFKNIFKKFNINTDLYTDKISIIVYGSFFISGGKDSPISAGNNNWNGAVVVMPKGRISFKNMILRYSFGIFVCEGAKLSKVKDCVIEQCCFSLCSAAKLVVKNNVIRFNEAGVICLKKSLTALNHIYSNTYHGIFVSSLKGYVIKNIITLNDTGIVCDEAEALKINENYINGNITGIQIKSSGGLELNNIVSYSNKVNIVVEQFCENISLRGAMISGTGINVKDFSEVNMEKAHIVIADYGIIAQNGAKVIADDIDCFGNAVNVTGVNNSMTAITGSFCHSVHANAIMHQEALFFADKNNLISDQRNILSFAASANICISDCNVESGDLFCHAESFSEICSVKNIVKTGMFCGMFDSSKIFLSGTLIEAERDVFVLSGKSKAHISDSNIKSESVFCSLSDRSEAAIYSSIIFAKERFCSMSDRTLLKVYGSNIASLENILEISGISNVFIFNTAVVNESGYLINLRDNAYINLTDSILIGESCISENSCAVAEFNNITVKTDGFLLDSPSSSTRCLNSFNNSLLKCKTLRLGDSAELEIRGSEAELEEGIEIAEHGKLVIRGSRIESGGYVVEHKGKEAVKIEGSEASGLEGLMLISGESVIEGSTIEGTKTGIEIRDRAEIELRGVKVKSGETGVKIEGTRKREFKGIEIESGEISIETEGSEIEIRESVIEGRGRIKGTGSIEIIDSEVGEIKAEGIGRAYVGESRINAEMIEIGDSAELEIRGSEAELEEGIIIKGSGKLNILNTKIESDNFGIKKTGNESLICGGISINSRGVCLDVSNSDMLVADGAALKSKTSYSVSVKKSKNVFLTGLEFSGNKGFCCSHTSNVRINKLNMRTISNLLKITDSDVLITDFDISSKIFQQSIFVEGKSKFSLSGGRLKLLDDFKYASDYPAIALRNSSCVSFKNVYMEASPSCDIKLVLCKEEVNFTAKNVTVKAFNNFLDVSDDSFAVVSDSDIETKSESVSLHDNAKADVVNTAFINADSFKFFVHDFSLLKIENISVAGGLLASCDKYAQIYSSKSQYDLSGNAVRMTGASALYDFNSTWKASSAGQNKYLFSLIDSSKLNVNKSEISLGQQYVFAIGKTEINILNSKIAGSNKHFLLDCRFNSKLNIVNTDITALFLLQLQDNSKAYIDKSILNIKSIAAKLSDSSMISVSNTMIKSTGRDAKGFISLNYSKINVINSAIDGFMDGIISGNSGNVNVDDTKINCKNSFLRRYTESVKNKALYPAVIRSIRLFVLNTRKNSVLNFCYRLIYLSSLKVYSFLCADNKYVQSVYLRRGMLNNDWIAGASDIDYLTVIKDGKLYAEIQHVSDIHRKYKKIKKIFPFYGENLIMNESELEFYVRYGGIRVNNLFDAKLLTGHAAGSLKTNLYKRSEKKLKTDIISEIMNSYILLSSNYFCDNDIVTDICFSKAAADILKYSEFFHKQKKPVNSRTDFLRSYLDGHESKENNVLSRLLDVLKNNAVLDKSDRNRIFDLLFKKLDFLCSEFNNFAGLFMNLKEIKKDKQTETGNILFDEKIPFLQKEMPFSSIIIDSPGICYVTINGSAGDKNNVYSETFIKFASEVKKIKILYTTPVMFFTQNMFRALLLSVFKGTPLNYLKLTNINSRYLHRAFYLKENTSFYCHTGVVLKTLVLEAVSDMSFHINDIDASKSFSENKDKLFSLLILIFVFNLYVKNAKINESGFADDIIDVYKSYNRDKNTETDAVLSMFEDNCEFPDLERTMKVIAFIKKNKNEIIKDYSDEL